MEKIRNCVCEVEWGECAQAYSWAHECEETPEHIGLHKCGCGATKEDKQRNRC